MLLLMLCFLYQGNNVKKLTDQFRLQSDVGVFWRSGRCLGTTFGAFAKLWTRPVAETSRRREAGSYAALRL